VDPQRLDVSARAVPCLRGRQVEFVRRSGLHSLFLLLETNVADRDTGVGGFRAETADDPTNGQVAQSRQGSVSGVLCLQGDMSTFGVATQYMATRVFGGTLLVGGGVQLHMCNSSRRRDAGCGHGRRHAHQ